jgi:hypothetical protein
MYGQVPSRTCSSVCFFASLLETWPSTSARWSIILTEFPVVDSGNADYNGALSDQTDDAIGCQLGNHSPTANSSCRSSHIVR